jgi:hypothetical protein
LLKPNPSTMWLNSKNRGDINNRPSAGADQTP